MTKKRLKNLFKKDDSKITKNIPIPEKIPKPSASSSEERDCDESIINDNTLISELKKDTSSGKNERFNYFTVKKTRNKE